MDDLDHIATSHGEDAQRLIADATAEAILADLCREVEKNDGLISNHAEMQALNGRRRALRQNRRK